MRGSSSKARFDAKLSGCKCCVDEGSPAIARFLSNTSHILRRQVRPYCEPARAKAEVDDGTSADQRSFSQIGDIADEQETPADRPFAALLSGGWAFPLGKLECVKILRGMPWTKSS